LRQRARYEVQYEAEMPHMLPAPRRERGTPAEQKKGRLGMRSAGRDERWSALGMCHEVMKTAIHVLTPNEALVIVFARRHEF